MRNFFLFIFIITYSITSGAIANPPDDNNPVEMSLSTIILFALDNNPDLLMAHERVTQMEEFAGEAKANYWPRVELEVKGGREYLSPTSDSKNNNYGKATLRLSQKIYDGYATASEVSRRESLIESTNIEALSQRDAVIVDTIKYYLNVLMYQSEVKTITRFNSELNAIVNNIKDMYEAGATSKVMNDYALSRHAASRQNLSKAKSSLNDSISNLEFLTGPLPKFSATNPDNLTPEKYEFDYYFEIAGSSHSNIKMLQKERDVLKHQLNFEKAAYLPSVDFNISAEQKQNDGGDTGSASDVKAYFNINYEIFDGFLRKHKTNRVSSQIKELDYKNQKIMKELKRNLQLSYHQILASQYSLASVHSEIISNMKVKLLNTENFQQGTINIIELIEGEERLKESYLKKHKLNHDLYLNKYNLLINSTILSADYFCSSCSEL